MGNERIAKARELLQQFPDNDLARFNLAQAYFDANDHERAAELLQPLCEKKPDWMVVHILLGKCQLVAGHAETGKKTLQHAHQLAVDQHHDGPREELEDLLATL
jgi:predicted Zn-dependent protease